jgi:pilus assembly protein Flp/PilA
MEESMLTRATTWLKLFAKSDEGVTAIEYGLIAGLISVVIIGAMTLVGSEVNTTFNTWTSAVQNAVQKSQGS